MGSLKSIGNLEYMNETVQLGCQINRYVGVELVKANQTDTEGKIFNLYVMIYQCNIRKFQFIKLALVRIYDDPESDYSNAVQFIQINPPLRMPHRVIDIKKTRLRKYTEKEELIFVGTLLMTLEIPNGNSNLLLVYDL